MAKTPALSTQLKQAREQIAQLEKQLAQEKTSHQYARDGRGAAEAEVEQMHAFFDAVPNSLPREPEGSYGKKNSAMTRLAAWLASK